MRVRGGKCSIGAVASGLVLTSNSSISDDTCAGAYTAKGITEPAALNSFHFDVTALEFRSKGSGGAHTPVASPYLSSREPLAYSRLEEIVNRYRYWIQLKLTYADTIPNVFCAIFDADSLKSYGNMFTLLMKVRLVYCRKLSDRLRN